MGSHGGSLEITLTVPLEVKKTKLLYLNILGLLNS